MLAYLTLAFSLLSSFNGAQKTWATVKSDSANGDKITSFYPESHTYGISPSSDSCSQPISPLPIEPNQIRLLQNTSDLAASFQTFFDTHLSRSCTTAYYLGMFSHSTSETATAQIWKAIENHEVFSDATSAMLLEAEQNTNPKIREKLLALKLHSRKCSTECSSLSLNAIYESLLAKNLLANAPLEQRFLNIYKKIFNSRMSDSNYSFSKSIQKWTGLDGRYRPWPFAEAKKQGSKITPDYIFSNSSLAFDYLVGTCYPPDRVGISHQLDPYNQDLYSNYIHRERGKVDCYHPSALKRQFGFVKFDVGVLNAGDRPSWERYTDGCLPPDPPDAPYDNMAWQHQIPWVGDISGSTTLALMTLFSSKVELSPSEMRLFLLSIFSTMAANGDHNLQEILSAAKLVSNYVSRKNYPHQKEPLIGEMPEFNKKTLQSLDEVTRDIDALGYDYNKFGKYGDFFSHIQDKEFTASQNKSKNELMEYYRKSCSN